MILVFLGAPGSGKGTQAKLLSDKLNIAHVSLGDVLRDEVNNQSEIGKKIKAIIDSGNLVPDEVVNELTRMRLGKADCASGFILDGFPRSLAQAEILDRILLDLNRALDKVVYFKLTETEVVGRLSGRRSCKTCGAVYHIKFNPPKTAGKCDRCGASLYQRADDSEIAIKRRFEVYESQTKPLILRYQKEQKLATIDAGDQIEKVFAELLKIIGNGKN